MRNSTRLERLRKLRDLLRRITRHPKPDFEFDMGTFGKVADEERQTVTNLKCVTRACALGSAALTPWF
jgi:hypothetical protein